MKLAQPYNGYSGAPYWHYSEQVTYHAYAYMHMTHLRASF